MRTPYTQPQPRQTLTAKATPDSASTIDLSGLNELDAFQLAIEPGRTADVTLVRTGGRPGQMLIPVSAGGDAHYPTPVFRVGDADSWQFSASSDTTVSFTVLRIP